ncbi:MAG: DUF456 domain-containing protein [Candidatus Eisenbacteria bacterium]|nr:DUF456 domain-containing protein [Candidatus Eisenbacteria bacterium]
MWSEIGMTALRIVGLVLLDAVLLAGLLAIPLGLGGNFILLGAVVVVGIVTRFTLFSWVALLVLAALTAAGEVLEALLGSLVARRYGATGWGMGGAFAGGLAGAAIGSVIFPLVGTLIGSFAGTALGAVLGERLGGTDEDRTARAGWGAFLGRSLASAIKLAIGFGMTVWLVRVTHFPGG